VRTSRISPVVAGIDLRLVLERPALHAACRCTCQWGGAITITTAGQEIIDVD
jgi:hypothetical protein